MLCLFGCLGCFGSIFLNLGLISYGGFYRLDLSLDDNRGFSFCFFYLCDSLDLRFDLGLGNNLNIGQGDWWLFFEQRFRDCLCRWLGLQLAARCRQGGGVIEIAQACRGASRFRQDQGQGADCGTADLDLTRLQHMADLVQVMVGLLDTEWIEAQRLTLFGAVAQDCVLYLIMQIAEWRRLFEGPVIHINGEVQIGQACLNVIVIDVVERIVDVIPLDQQIVGFIHIFVFEVGAQ